MSDPLIDPNKQTGAPGATPAVPPDGGTPPAGGATDAAAPGVRPTTAAMPDEVLKYRLDRERERGEKDAQERLFKAYGVSSKEELDKKLARVAELEQGATERAAKEEEAKRASMSNEERLKADLAAEKNKVAELERQLGEARGELATTRMNQVVRAAAVDFIDPDFIEEAGLLFAAHVRSLKQTAPEKIARYEKPSEVRDWFRKLATEKPRMAKPATDAAAQEAAKTKKVIPPRKPITTGVKPAGAVPPTPGRPVVQDGGKTARPGQKNSMKRDEVNELGKSTFGAGFQMP